MTGLGVDSRDCASGGRLAVIVVALCMAVGCTTSRSVSTETTERGGETSRSTTDRDDSVDRLETASECTGIIARTVELVNEQRSQRGLGTLRCDAEVGRAAAVHAEDLCRHSRFSHTGTDGSSMVDRARRVGLEFRTLGENVAKGQRSADEVVDEWMASPGHRKNILNVEFQRIGVAYTRCPQSRPIWVQVFAG
jgi:uncharacterized protein YkwD